MQPPLRLADGTTIQTLINAKQAYPAMLKAINQATSSILFSNYCMERGEVFAEFAAALTAAAQRGVTVCLMLDSYISKRHSHREVAALQAAGVKVLWRRPFQLSQLHHYNQGLHKKLLIVDHTYGFTGGVGVADYWQQPTRRYPAPWRDTHFRITGPVVSAMVASYERSWQTGGGQPPLTPQSKQAFSGDAIITPLESGPKGHGLTPFGRTLLKLINGTQHQLTISTAYFGPSRPIAQALQAAARRGVQVRILTNGPYCTHKVARDCGRHLYQPVLAAGIHIYEYQPSVVHTKAITSDDTTSIIGSANLNFRSLYHDEEFSLVIHNPDLVRQLNKQFGRDLKHAVKIDPATWARRPASAKLRQAAAGLARYIF